VLDHVGVGAAWEPTERLLTETGAHEAEHGLYMGQVTSRRVEPLVPAGVRDLFVFPHSTSAPRAAARPSR